MSPDINTVGSQMTLLIAMMIGIAVMLVMIVLTSQANNRLDKKLQADRLREKRLHDAPRPAHCKH